jgi:putative transcriptional regulator
MKSAFEKIAAGMDDAIAFSNGDKGRGRIHEPVDVKAIRAATNMSQSEFARAFRLPLNTVQDWEQNRRKPEAPARVLLSLIAADSVAVQRLIAANP